ncbi:MAG: acyltransferase [Proteobacteria bacterium]|nr:acyltransferase [Pseudomonadota bacterium]
MKYASIQVLRAVAASMVVLFHLEVLRIGSAGVDIFFIISGFIMGSIGLRDAPVSFLKKRIIRLVPLYWMVTLLMCGASLKPGLFDRFTFTGEALAKSLLFVPYYNAEGYIWPLVVPGWTLNYEMFFYALFAIGLALGRPFVVTLGLLACSVAAGMWMQPENPLLKTWTDSLLIEFAAGLLLARYQQRVRGVGPALLLFTGSALGYVWLMQTPPGDIPLRVLQAGGPAFLLVCGAIAMERVGKWPRMRVAELLGDASYSLYLLHGLVISACHKLLGKFITLPASVETVLIFALALVVGVLSFVLVEKPLSGWLRRLLLQPKGGQPRGDGV